MNPMRMRPPAAATAVTPAYVPQVHRRRRRRPHARPLRRRGARAASGPGRTVGSAAAGAFEPNAFLRVGTDNTVTVIVEAPRDGPGRLHRPATLVAEELDAAWTQVRVEGAPADAKLYSNLFWGPAQGTGGSTALANSFEQYRQAGATARAMLVAAAAAKWNVPAESITVKGGVVSRTRAARRPSSASWPTPPGSKPVPTT